MRIGYTPAYFDYLRTQARTTEMSRCRAYYGKLVTQWDKEDYDAAPLGTITKIEVPYWNHKTDIQKTRIHFKTTEGVKTYDFNTDKLPEDIALGWLVPDWALARVTKEREYAHA